MRARNLSRTSAFTLVELLIVMGIVVLLAGLLLPAVQSAREAARAAECLSNERQIGIAINAYASDYKGVIPYGPKAPPDIPSNFYPGTGDVTSLLSMLNGQPVGLGLMIKTYLASTPRVLFCPGTDQTDDALAELALVGNGQAQCDYFYRHGSNDAFSDAITPPSVDHIRLGHLGLNSVGRPIRALVMDQDYIAGADLASFGIYTRTNHSRKFVNVLYSDGHAVPLDNSGGQYTINPTIPLFSFNLILHAFETADAQP